VPAEVHPRVIRGEGHNAVVRNFVAAIRGGDWAALNGQEGLLRAQIIDACYQSALQGHEVALVGMLSQ
jgi:predicted dehydrogenase